MHSWQSKNRSIIATSHAESMSEARKIILFTSFFKRKHVVSIVSMKHMLVLLDFSLTVKAAPHEWIIRTSQL